MILCLTIKIIYLLIFKKKKQYKNETHIRRTVLQNYEGNYGINIRFIKPEKRGLSILLPTRPTCTIGIGLVIMHARNRQGFFSL